LIAGGEEAGIRRGGGEKRERGETATQALIFLDEGPTYAELHEDL